MYVLTTTNQGCLRTSLDKVSPACSFASSSVAQPGGQQLLFDQVHLLLDERLNLGTAFLQAQLYLQPLLR